MSFITKQESYKIPQPVVIQPANNQVATTSPVATHGHVVGRQPNRPRLIHVSVMVVHGAVTLDAVVLPVALVHVTRGAGVGALSVSLARLPLACRWVAGRYTVNQSFSQLVRKAGRSADTYMQTHHHYKRESHSKK